MYKKIGDKKDIEQEAKMENQFSILCDYKLNQQNEVERTGESERERR